MPQPDCNSGVSRKIYIKPGAESDESETLSWLHIVPFYGPAYSTPRNKTSKLNKDDFTGIRGLKSDPVTLILFRGLIKIGRKELSRAIGDILNDTSYGDTVHMDI